MTPTAATRKFAQKYNVNMHRHISYNQCDGDLGKVLLLLRHNLASLLQLEKSLESGRRFETPGRQFVKSSTVPDRSKSPGRCPWTEPGEGHRSRAILLQVLNRSLTGRSNNCNCRSIIHTYDHRDPTSRTSNK